MSLPSGTRLGPYEILTPIGAGGMGEVYRARDARLGREVAVKVLPEAFARDLDRRARFERETKAIAALSHPNILAIFDVGVAEDTAYAVTELLDGQTLRERMNAGPLPVRKAVDIAAQMLRGLAAAHDKGIVHRDFKPENVFLLDDGQVKVLDFGLARQTGVGTDSTETAAVTDPGTVLGTMGYMAPEQLRGQPVDARVDLFAFGAVLYEMLSGTRAFQRDTAADTMSAILNQDPPELAGSRPDFSPALDRIVRHCLEKRPAERFQSARDVAFALEALSGSATSAQPVVVERRRSRWLALAGGGAAILAALAVGYWAGRGTIPEAAATSTRFTTMTFEPQLAFNARFAPDGQTIVYSAAVQPDTPELFVIRPGSALPQRIGRPGMHLLSISSKGELAVLTDARPQAHRLMTGTLARMTMDGEPRAWMENVREADWSPDGSTLAIVRFGDGRDRLEYPIGKTLYETQGYISDPRVSPDGSRVAFMDHQVKFDDRGWIKMVDRNGQVTTLAGEYWGEEGLAWSADGGTIYFSAAGNVPGVESYQPMAVSTGSRPVVREALSSIGTVIMLDVARDGQWLVMRQDTQASIRALVPGAPAEREFPWLNNAINPSLSRDGSLLLFTDQSQSAGSTYSVAMRRTDGSPAVRLGEGNSRGISPDGRWGLGMVTTPPRLAAYPTGTGEAFIFDRAGLVRYTFASWFPDSRRVVVCGNEASKPVRCYEQDLAGGAPKPLTPEGVVRASISPDGRLIGAAFPDGGKIWPLSGGSPAPVPGLTPADSVVVWTSDSRGMIVQPPGRPVRLERLDLATGKRTPIRTIEPPDGSGLVSLKIADAIDDGRYYAYGYSKELTTLFTVTGVR